MRKIFLLLLLCSFSNISASFAFKSKGYITPKPCLNTHKDTKWGFFAHQRINQLAIFTLPPEMISFYKTNLYYIVEHSVAPDRRRYAVQDEAPKHYIDLDSYGDSAIYKLPHYWNDAVEKFSEDSLFKHGIVPWHIQFMKFQLTKAFEEKNAQKILKVSAEIGHYIADANVPLHTSSNYNGQKTNQIGIHGFWESRLPELFASNYDFLVGSATYEKSISKRTWEAVSHANACLDSVFAFEKYLNASTNTSKKYSIEEHNGQNVKKYAKDYSKKYHEALSGQVERQMRRSIKMIGDFWYTAWIDAGQPDLSNIQFVPSAKEKQADEKEQQTWLQKLFKVRDEN
ncbi:zinc dependent phospholipase C family protein [Arcicella aquatica]|uniref:Zinc dependent phospholipase C family protein n=1 Tax=Arcicella aquatica TaxID=217141 RepID=A0ABU5QJ74_9BACT|nr:zinc dependent phospholipase C family protein [Arcicella aquatica]MEA5256779.1 zinc dependent phospholipase C family protein [Arcicella aquatica]